MADCVSAEYRPNRNAVRLASSLPPCRAECGLAAGRRAFVPAPSEGGQNQQASVGVGHKSVDRPLHLKCLLQNYSKLYFDPTMPDQSTDTHNNVSHPRTQAMLQRLRQAMHDIEAEVVVHHGVYPYNHGRVTQSELCRRADVTDRTN